MQSKRRSSCRCFCNVFFVGEDGWGVLQTQVSMQNVLELGVSQDSPTQTAGVLEYLILGVTLVFLKSFGV